MNSIPHLKILLAGFITCVALVVSAEPEEQDFELPSLGDSSSSLFSLQQEHELGRVWLQAFRSRAKTQDDPLTQYYIENLVYRLARHSELQDRRLEVIVVENPTLNAFAVPGGIIGLHNGMLLTTRNEAQLAGVMAHELAHLSQRHFVRSVEKARAGALPSLALLLAGIVLAATSNSDAGIAAITAGQAAALQTQLKFSREHEKEADRVGMQTLAKSGMDPNGIPAMFENMAQFTRHTTTRIPEFLRTHPLTESRISDGTGRARQYPRKVYTDSLDFQLIRERVTLHLTDNPDKHLQRLIDREPATDARQYGIVLTLTKLGRWDDAEKMLSPLLAESPYNMAYVIAQTQILEAKQQLGEAINLLRRNLALAPDNYPLSFRLAQVLQAAGSPHEAEEELTRLSRLRPSDPLIWYHLAEVRGLAGNIIGVHQARAEYFILNGYLDSADKQLHYAYPLAANDHITRRRITQRVKDIQAMRAKLKKL